MISSPSKISVVVFDVDGTLLSLRKGLGELYAEALKGCGYDVDSSTLEGAIRAVWRSFEAEYLNEAEAYRSTPAREVLMWFEFVRRVLQRVRPEIASDSKALEAVYSFFARGESRILATEAQSVCQQLRDRGIAVYAATNNDLRTTRVLGDVGLLPLLSAVFTAGELGWKKPSLHFFERVAQRCGAPPEAILHVGNSYELDVAPPRALGIQAVLYDPGIQHRGLDGRIALLAELLTLVP